MITVMEQMTHENGRRQGGRKENLKTFTASSRWGVDQPTSVGTFCINYEKRLMYTNVPFF
jgi:hypothetical protein